MVSVVRSFVKSWALSALIVLAFAGAANAAGNAAEKSDAEKAELVAEIAVRDSVMAIHDSVCIVEKKALRSDLEIEKPSAKTGNRATTRSRRTTKLAPRP